MHISAKSDYALRALVHLACLHSSNDTEPVSIRVLAQQNDIPKRFLEHIMIELRERGWVRSIAGRDGGFVIAKPPIEITMGQVIRHFDGDQPSITDVTVGSDKYCGYEATRRFRQILQDIQDYTTMRLDETTLASLTIAVQEKKQFKTRIYIDGSGI